MRWHNDDCRHVIWTAHLSPSGADRTGYHHCIAQKHDASEPPYPRTRTHELVLCMSVPPFAWHIDNGYSKTQMDCAGQQIIERPQTHRRQQPPICAHRVRNGLQDGACFDRAGLVFRCSLGSDCRMRVGIVEAGAARGVTQANQELYGY